MQHAFLAAALASVVGGVIGMYLFVRRMTAISGGISHATFGGVGLGYLLGFPRLPVPQVLLFRQRW